jgi:hypothetical protein
VQKKAKDTKKGASDAQSRREARDELLIEALASYPTNRAAAAAAKVSERTVRRRLEDDDFRQRVVERRAEKLEEFQQELDVGRRKAYETALQIVDDRAAGPTSRLRAAQLLWGMHAESSRLDIERRLVLVEQRAEQTQSERTDRW